MSKKGVAVVVLLVCALFLLPSVSANFVCGEVNGTGGVSPSWFNVIVYYSSNPEFTTSCKVSPADNKYCCTPLDIKNVSWAIGKNVSAKIFSKGYAASPVSLRISGEGYDVFPMLHLRKIVNINQPNQTVFVNASSVLVNFTTEGDFNNLSYRLNDTQTLVIEGSLCSSCNGAQFTLDNLSSGNYYLELTARNSAGLNVTEVKKFTFLDFVNYGRKVECKRCKKGIVFSGEVVNVTVYAEFSHNVSGSLYDYFPNEWQFVSGGQYGDYSNTHNSVKWEVIGKNVSATYSLKAPNSIFTRKYVFRSAFEDYLDSTPDKISVYRFYPFLGFPDRFLRDIPNRNYYVQYSSISPENPLVLSMNDSLLTQLAIFPDHEIEDVFASVTKNSILHMPKSSDNFLILSNFGSIDKVFIKFKVKKQNKREVLNISLYQLNLENSIWQKLNITKLSEDDKYGYYESYTQDTGFFAVKKEGKNG